MCVMAPSSGHGQPLPSAGAVTQLVTGESQKLMQAGDELQTGFYQNCLVEKPTRKGVYAELFSTQATL